MGETLLDLRAARFQAIKTHLQPRLPIPGAGAAGWSRLSREKQEFLPSMPLHGRLLYKYSHNSGPV